ncbi:hypothetical protein DNK47_00885 [Mycoplasma wenyonii]|uniref:Uncharacterized protein n=1 Tax=Mycoplasma wenyonii TaxID=65123 RepID=A0A328PVL4_9MOLU|nr:hypothetical protein [Mycoplasma wenyonii]RAO95169.1 hypothetical protein DNK47_00885 [Mycoplasma wenyonii]
MSKLTQKELQLTELALKFLDSKPSHTVFQLSKKLVDSWVKSKLFTPLKDKNFSEFSYVLINNNKRYLLRELEGKYYLLCSEEGISDDFSKLTKLSEVKKVTQIVNLEKALKEQISKQERVFSGDSSEPIVWACSLPRLFHLFELKELHIKTQEEVKNLSDLSWDVEAQLSNSYGRGDFIYQEDSIERSSQLGRKIKVKDKQIKESLSLSSPFNSPNDLFSSVSMFGPRNRGKGDDARDQDEDFFNDEDKQMSEEVKSSLIELLPSPTDNYKDVLNSLSRDKMRAKYFNPNFPFSSVIELNNSHHFWAIISPKYKDVETFTTKLKSFYSSLSAYDVEKLLISSDPTNNKNVWLQLQENTNLSSYDSKSSSFKDLLDNKLEGLRAKNEQLTTHLGELRKSLIEQGKYPDTDLLYLQSIRDKKKILEEIENTCKVLNRYSDRLQQYSEKHIGFSPNFYLSIFGSKAILSKYDSLVCNALLDLNDQLNEIVFYQQEVEKLLFERLSTLHQARKAEMKLEFLEQEDSLSRLVLSQQQSVSRINRAEELRRLEIQGSLELSKHAIQKEIEAEKSKLSSYLSKLQKLDYFPDFEEQSQQLRNQKATFKKKVDAYREEIYGLKLKAEAIERQYSSFITAVREQILDFQKEISGYYANHLSLLHSSVNQVWVDWANEGIDHLEKILARKKELIKEFSEIIVLEIKKMYSTQDSLLEESRARKKEWDRVYQEIVDEFKTLGYYLSTPKPSEHHHRHLPKMDKSVFNLSEEIKKLIYYRPSLKYTKPKVNELIGLSPKILNDEDFLVIDQVWTKLTPIQEFQLKEKIMKESQEKDRERIDKLIQKAKDDLEKKLKEKDYKFKTLTFERDFPQEADEEERYNKLKEFEKASFHNWKEIHFTTSELRHKFQDMLTHLSKKLFTLKEVEKWGDKINISDQGKFDDSDTVEKLSEFDYFFKTSEKLSLVDSCPLTSFKEEETDLYDLEDEGYLSILEALDEDKTPSKSKMATPKKGMMPKLEDWAHLNLKRYREEKKKVDIVEIEEGLLSLEKEIQTLKKASGNYRDACELERNRREILFSEMTTDLDNLKQYLEQEENELNQIFAEASDMIDLNFEEIDRRLEARRKLISELKESKDSISSR